jgi:hypothetical protein
MVNFWVAPHTHSTVPRRPHWTCCPLATMHGLLATMRMWWAMPELRTPTHALLTTKKVWLTTHVVVLTTRETWWCSRSDEVSELRVAWWWGRLDWRRSRSVARGIAKDVTLALSSSAACASRRELTSAICSTISAKVSRGGWCVTRALVLRPLVLMGLGEGVRRAGFRRHCERRRWQVPTCNGKKH